MKQKYLFLKQVQEIIDQHNTILSDKKLIYDAQERRKQGFTIYTVKCPICVYKDGKCPPKCFISQNKGCLKHKTKPQNKYSFFDLQKRLMFWVLLKNYANNWPEHYFNIKSREHLYNRILQIDDIIYNQY